MKRTMLTVSGRIPATINADSASGMRPRADYVELARAFDADLLDVTGAERTRIGRMLVRAGGKSLALAWGCFAARHEYDMIVTDSEAVGLPLALLFKLLPHRPRHCMIAHVLSTKTKRLFFDWFRAQDAIDRVFVYATWQRRFLIEQLGLPQEQVVLTPFMVDTHFFDPERVMPQPHDQPRICAVGLERRDYPTLLQAIATVDAHLTIAAASPWANQPDTTQNQVIPANVTVQRFNQYDLRQLYANCAFLVMPLFDVPFQAGVTALLEAMAMGKAVICSGIHGQTDVVRHGETGIYVPPGDPVALREAIEYLLAHPDQAAQMGAAGRRRVESLMQLDTYAQRLASYVRAVPSVARVLGEA